MAWRRPRWNAQGSDQCHRDGRAVGRPSYASGPCPRNRRAVLPVVRLGGRLEPSRPTSGGACRRMRLVEPSRQTGGATCRLTLLACGRAGAGRLPWWWGRWLLPHHGDGEALVLPTIMPPSGRSCRSSPQAVVYLSCVPPRGGGEDPIASSRTGSRSPGEGHVRHPPIGPPTHGDKPRPPPARILC